MVCYSMWPQFCGQIRCLSVGCRLCPMLAMSFLKRFLYIMVSCWPTDYLLTAVLRFLYPFLAAFFKRAQHLCTLVLPEKEMGIDFVLSGILCFLCYLNRRLSVFLTMMSWALQKKKNMGAHSVFLILFCVIATAIVVHGQGQAGLWVSFKMKFFFRSWGYTFWLEPHSDYWFDMISEVHVCFYDLNTSRSKIWEHSVDLKCLGILIKTFSTVTELINILYHLLIQVSSA